MTKQLPLRIFILSMIFVFLLALVYIAGLYFILNPAIKNNTLIKSTPVTSPPVSLTFNLSNPDDNLLVFDADLLIQGKTSPNAIVLLSSNENDKILEINNQGEFSTTLKLESGVNNLIISTFDNSGSSKTEKRTVFYSEEKI